MSPMFPTLSRIPVDDPAFSRDDAHSSGSRPVSLSLRREPSAEKLGPGLISGARHHEPRREQSTPTNRRARAQSRLSSGNRCTSHGL